MSQGVKIGQLRGGIDFTFKVFLRPYISQIRMFAIKNFLIGVFLMIILDPVPIFQVDRCCCSMLYWNFCLFFECVCEFGLFKDLKGNWMYKITTFTTTSQAVGQKSKNFGQKKTKSSNSIPLFCIFSYFNLFQDKFKIN